MTRPYDHPALNAQWPEPGPPAPPGSLIIEPGPAQGTITGEALILRPGDRLLIALQDRLPEKDLDDMLDKLRTELPGVHAVLFDGVAQLAAYRPDPIEALDTSADPGEEGRAQDG